jgi:lipopolysaccharide/colanic/teichoic acid biosynthesis glycosyltransferase
VTLKTFRFRILIADLCWAVVAMALAYGLRYERQWQSPARLPAPDFLPFLLFVLLFWTALSSWVHLDGYRGGWRFSAILSQLLPAVATLMLLLFAGGYLARWYASRFILNVFGIMFLLGLVAIRLISRGSLESRYRSGAVRKAVIIGSGPVATEIARKIESHPEMLWEVSGFLCPAENAHSVSILEPAASSSISVRSVGITELLRGRGIDDLIIAVSRTEHPEISDLIARCRREGIGISLVPQPYELYLSQPKLLDLDGLPLLKLGAPPAIQGTPAWKRALDLALSTFLLLITGPAILAVGAWFKIRKGRAFSSETRCGQYGKAFTMYRLNSDRHAVGLPFREFVMQQSSFTELPQLLNVFRGEMSLVGPRPEGPEKVRHYSDWHRQRLSVRPGMTGLAQVHGLRDQNSSEDKTRYDLQYILHRSLFLDISLLLQTTWTLALRSFRHKPDEVELPLQRSEVSLPPALQESLSSAHSSQSGTD